MNIEHQHHQFLNICKICKKVYKDKGGLMEHKRLQHSQDLPSPTNEHSQVHQLAMNRFNKEVGLQKSRKIIGGARNFTGKDERYNNGEPPSSASTLKNLRMESYATLQKPPASLKPKLLQSRAIRLTKNDSSAPIPSQSSKSPFDFEDNEGEADEWKKWEPEKEKELGAMIITASVAHSTAACYSPTGQPIKKPFADIKETLRTQSLTSAASDLPHKAPLPAKRSEGSKIPLPLQQSGAPKLGSVLTKSTSSINNSTNGPTGSGRPPHQTLTGIPNSSSMNKFGGRITIPKLMSKTKAQFKILKSQATRPKILPRNSMNNALPRVGLEDHPTTPTTISPPKLTKQADLPPAINQERFQNPPQLLRELSSNKSKLSTSNQDKMELHRPRGGRGGSRRLSPPRTRVTANPSTSTISPERSRGGGRGRPRGRGGPRRGGLPPVVRRESLHSPSGSDSGCSDDSMDDPSDSVYPPPAKISRAEDDRIFGADYKCPPVGKVASYLNKKGIRVWICLVCEETEEEISRGPMICCDTCEDWYHFSCVGIDDEPPDDEKWFCKRCIYKKLQGKLQKSNGRGKKRGRGTNRGRKRF